MKSIVIIPAAGTGSRMGAEIPKQFLDLNGVPIIIRTIQKFHNMDTKIYIGVSEDNEKILHFLLEKYSLHNCKLVKGGDTRQQTVSNCLNVVDDDVDVVVVHDAVRPFVTEQHISEVINQAYKSGASLSAMPAKDTIKQKLKTGKLKTINRENIYYAATPQAATLKLLKEAHSQEIITTDEASLIEALGKKIDIVECDYNNIKITTPQDMDYAEFLVAKLAEKDKKSTNVVIYTDGACSGNPGPGGYGAILMLGDKRKELSQGYKYTTNNRMEIMAVIASLEQLKKPCNVELYSDSKYVIDSITKGWVYDWQKRNWIISNRKPAINIDLWERLLPLLELHKVNFIWVKGHSSNPYNNRCDEIAVAASKKEDLLEDKAFN